MVSGVAAEMLAVALLAGVLLSAMLQPRGLPEATVAVPAAAMVVALGIVSPTDALRQIQSLGPTVGFLAAILVLAYLADEAGMFTWLGSLLGTLSAGQPVRLLGLVFAAAAVITAVLSLDATVVLLTPVVFRTAVSLGLRAKPHVYACTHLANSASTLLPVSNLTNLLAFSATGLSFMQFAAFMGLPWLAVIAVEYLVFRWFFRDDLRPVPVVARVDTDRVEPDGPTPAPPVFVLAVLAATLVGFGASGLVGVEPVWVAVAGAGALAVRSVARREITLPSLVVEASPFFCVFVFALGIVVAGVTGHGMGRALGSLLPTDPSFAGLLGVALLAALLANVVNNLPATLVMLGVLGLDPHPGLVLAMLIGVNVGPNLTYVGSLATLLWRRVLASRDAAPTLTEFLRLGVLTVPVGLLSGVGALWLGLTMGGGMQ
ncbi:arsenic transporter [Mycolicibacterium cyprinidarum]|uniref:Arsenic transporter n=1 Tax=Mycolicibacterium cyprinidarum TaxID=2860311 RepID=A0ABQ4V8H6_9MYCO|nr:arsenic transporter [Mycolicibacterium sp. NGTWSNA01]GJF17599.1 arsenic transporter [Mycolicibacterium sp. NGTWS0302]